MSILNSHTTADYLDWNVMLNLIRKLYRAGDYRMSLFIGCGCFFGIRVSDLRKLTWSMLLSDDKFIINEQKTSKRRVVKINSDFQKHIQQCYDALNIEDMNEACFLSRKNMVMSTQRINVRLKEIKKRYNVKIDNFSCHSLRKAFGRKVFESSGENAQMALGLREKELLETYDLLDF